jgi:hypothetical protein
MPTLDPKATSESKEPQSTPPEQPGTLQRVQNFFQGRKSHGKRYVRPEASSPPETAAVTSPPEDIEDIKDTKNASQADVKRSQVDASRADSNPPEPQESNVLEPTIAGDESSTMAVEEGIGTESPEPISQEYISQEPMSQDSEPSSEVPATDAKSPDPEPISQDSEPSSKVVKMIEPEPFSAEPKSSPEVGSGIEPEPGSDEPQI